MGTVTNINQLEREFLSLCKDNEKLLYFKYAAGENETDKNNEKAFKQLFIKPRMLRNVASVDSTTSLLGVQVSFPIGISPTAYHHLADKEGEFATVRAALEEDCPVVLSCLSSKKFPEIAEACPNSHRWLQTYIFKDRSITLDHIRMAEEYGYQALVITIDSPVAGLWKFKTTGDYFTSYLKFPHHFPKPVAELLDPSLEFKDLLWLKEQTKLPIVVKGVLSGEDALESVRYGASAIIVSNHGGRQIEGVVPTIDVLEEIIEAVSQITPKVEVYLDGGIRTGSDVFRACALGARAVFVGKPVIWGLSLNGKEGVRKVLQILKTEFSHTMRLAGVRNLQEMKKSLIWKTGCQCRSEDL